MILNNMHTRPPTFEAELYFCSVLICRIFLSIFLYFDMILVRIIALDRVHKIKLEA